jgi:hypothetical protein
MSGNEMTNKKAAKAKSRLLKGFLLALGSFICCAYNGLTLG